MKFRARTIRMRLTLIYGVVFLLTGAALLTIGYLLVRHNLDSRHTLREDARRLALEQLYPNAAPPPVQPRASRRRQRGARGRRGRGLRAGRRRRAAQAAV